MRIETAEIPITDFIKVWCEHCGIRIDPHEERTGVGGKTYHPHCYSESRSVSLYRLPKTYRDRHQPAILNG